MKPELWIAVYGAVTGTIAVAHQVSQWFLDRANVKVTGQIAIESTDRLAVVLSVRAVNVGRRPVKIRQVLVSLSTEAAPWPAGLPPEKTAEFKQMHAVHWVSSERYLFGARGEKALELSPDGGDYTWRTEIQKGVRFVSDTKQGEKYGKGQVVLTTGKKVPFNFLLLKDDQWPPSGKPQKQI